MKPSMHRKFGPFAIYAAGALAGWMAVAMPLAALAQDGGRIVINVATTILAEPSVESPLPILVGPVEALPKNSFLRIRGLPAAASLSDGHAISSGSWAVPMTALPMLKILAPISAAGKADLSISVMAIDGATLAETKATLLVAAASLIAPAPTARPPAPSTSIASLGATPPPPATPTPRLVARPAPEPEPNRLSPADRDRAVKLVQRGDDQLREGDVSAARLFYQRAADIGFAPAAMAVAATYDPDELGRLGVRGLQPDREAAKRWYERARDLGSADAGERLRRLGAR